MQYPPTHPAVPQHGRHPLDEADAAGERGDTDLALALALQVLASTDEPATRVRAGHRAAQCLFRQGRLAELVALGTRCWPAPDRWPDLPAAAEWLRWHCLCAAELGQHQVAMTAALELVARAERAGRPRAQALALNALGACYERMGDPWQAERLMLEGLERARQDGGLPPLLMSLNNLSAVALGAFHLLREDVDEAAAGEALQRATAYAREAMALAAMDPDPFHRLFIDGNLGEALLHLGQHDEADQLLQRALSTAERGAHLAQAWRIRCTQAEGDLLAGQPVTALARLATLTEPVWAEVPVATRIRLHQVRYRAHKAQGALAEALQEHEAGDRLLRRRQAQQVRAQAQMMVTRTEAERSRLQAERAQLEAQLARARAAELALRASQDALTGLGNRRLLDEQLPLMLRQAQEQSREIALVLIDIDHFKAINDRHGHRVGDQVLVALAQCLRQGTRSADLLARIGGEEFLVALPDADLCRATEACERLRERVERFDWGSVQPGLAVTVSIGLAMAPPHDPGVLFDQADRALYRAKQAGRNRVRAG